MSLPVKSDHPELLAAGEGPSPAALEIMPRAGELTQFKPFLQVLEDNEARALAMTINATMPAEARKLLAKDAHTLRLSLKKARCDADKAKDKLLENVKAFSKKVHSVNGDIWDRCEAAEKHLFAIEEFEETERLRIEAELRAFRAADLAPYLTGPLAVDLGKLTHEQYTQCLDDAKDLHDLRLKREREAKELADKQAREAEEERKRVAEERRLEAEKQKAEIARLKKEAQEKEAERLAEVERLRKEQAAREAAALAERKAAEAQAAAELKALEEKTRIEREAREKEQAAERARLAEESRLEREKLAKENAAREAAAAEERKRLAAEKAEADKRAAALQQAEDERIAAEAKRAKEEALAAKRAAAAPDVEKLKAVTVPELNLADHGAAMDYAQLCLQWREGVAILIAKMEGRAK